MGNLSLDAGKSSEFCDSISAQRHSDTTLLTGPITGVTINQRVLLRLNQGRLQYLCVGLREANRLRRRTTNIRAAYALTL